MPAACRKTEPSPEWPYFHAPNTLCDMNLPLEPLHALSPVDGRYADKTAALRPYFSEAALMRYRCLVEIEYLIALSDTGVIPGQPVTPEAARALRELVTGFSEVHADRIKSLERGINHDVKAIEYFLKEQLDELGLTAIREYVHLGLTSQDINNSAFPLMIRDALREILLPAMRDVLTRIRALGQSTLDLPMLARTHGQPASPTTFGKEMLVFAERMESQIAQMEQVELRIKFGGATGNFNAHLAAFPDIDWVTWADTFAQRYLSIGRYRHTTQIEPYDQLAALCHAGMRINTILIDFSRDIWTYISMHYLTQQAVAGEVGSSAMPHKVNPIDFENAEGNLGYANAIYAHFADKLPISRLQRDLTDSTVLRNIGVPIAHTLIALQALQKGMGKIAPNSAAMQQDLEANWAVLAEAIQTILRAAGVANPYEKLKDLTRGQVSVTRASLHAFIDQLDVPDDLKTRLRALRPDTYIGVAGRSPAS